MIIYYFSKCIALELMRKKLWSFLFIYMSGKSTPWNLEHFFKIPERKKRDINSPRKLEGYTDLK